jgi:hypothetical protein
MRRTWRRYWPVFAVVLAALAVLVFHVAADRLTREPPNYAHVEDGLYLGGAVREPPPGTGAVLNLCEVEDPYRAEVHRWEPIRDGEPAPTLAWLEEQVGFITAQRSAGRAVYVHCRNGASRSGMVVVAHLMARHGWARDEAMTFVRSRRLELRPNPAFLELLLEWERRLKAEGRGA